MQTGTVSSSLVGVRDRLLDAAEKLVALKGEAAASSRAIISEAGQRHNSAITYHFGNRRALFDAVWERRSTAVEEYRRPMLQALGTPTLPGLVEVYIRPLASYLDARSPSYWARFNEEALRRYPLQVPPRLRTNLRGLDGAGLVTLLDVFEQLERLTCGGAEPAAGLRVTQVIRTVITTFAAWERDRAPSDLSATRLADHLIPGVVGMLQAPCAGSALDARA